MFTCPNCKAQSPKLISTGHGIKCPACDVHISFSPAYLHNKAGLGHNAKNVTEVQKRHMWERTIGADNKVVMRSNPSREWYW